MKDDLLDPHRFALDAEELKALRNGSSPPFRPPVVPKRKQPIPFYQFPGKVIEALNEAGYAPAWVLAAAVFETWYRDYEKKNPVKLTSESLKRYRISRHQKRQALRVLEATGQYTVERTFGKNPRVIMRWLLIKE